MEINNNNEDMRVELAKANAAGLSPKRVAQEIDEFVEEVEGQLTVDVYQTPDEFVIQSAVAGVDPENLDVSISNESVTIRGKRERSDEVKVEEYLYQECYWGKFARTVILPQEVDAEKSVAAIKNGVLTVRLPKISRERTKKLKVKMD